MPFATTSAASKVKETKKAAMCSQGNKRKPAEQSAETCENIPLNDETRNHRILTENRLHMAGFPDKIVRKWTIYEYLADEEKPSLPVFLKEDREMALQAVTIRRSMKDYGGTIREIFKKSFPGEDMNQFLEVSRAFAKRMQAETNQVYGSGKIQVRKTS